MRSGAARAIALASTHLRRHPRAPFVRVVAEHAYDDIRALKDGQLPEQRAIATVDRLREREDDVPDRSGGQFVCDELVRSQ